MRKGTLRPSTAVVFFLCPPGDPEAQQQAVLNMEARGFNVNMHRGVPLGLASSHSAQACLSRLSELGGVHHALSGKPNLNSYKVVDGEAARDQSSGLLPRNEVDWANTSETAQKLVEEVFFGLA